MGFMNSPYFKKLPPIVVIVLTMAILPLIYYISIFLTKNKFIYVFQIALFLLPSLALLKLYTIKNAANSDSLVKKIGITVLLTLVITAVLNYTLGLWLEIFTPPVELAKAMEDLMLVGKPYGFVRDLLILALVPAICEEFFFRGFIQTSLSAYFKPRNAIVITSFFFALYHANPWFAPFYFILGFFFGMIYEKTNNLNMAILAHFVNNAYGIVLYHYFGMVI